MIKINLLPGGAKRAKRRLPTLQLPSFNKGGLDSWVLASTLIVAGAVGWMGYAYLSMDTELDEVSMGVIDAQRDSAQFADLIAKTNQLTAQRDSVAKRVAIIQEIDQGRFSWAHILDEVARSVPDFTWLIGVSEASVGEELLFRVEGRAGNIFAMTQFMDNLSASPFIRKVDLVQQDQVTTGNGRDGQVVHQFTLEATYQHPPLEFIETIPLFGESLADQEGS